MLGKDNPSQLRSRGTPSQQSRNRSRVDYVRRAVSSMSLAEIETPVSRVDVWPSNIAVSRDAAQSGYQLPSLSKPALLESLAHQVRFGLSGLAAQFPQFREDALRMPIGIGTSASLHTDHESLDDGAMMSLDATLGWWSVECGSPEGGGGGGKRYHPLLHQQQQPPPLLVPIESESYDKAHASKEDIFRAARLQVFRDTAKLFCSELRTYRPLLLSVFAEYDSYIQFCNRFVVEEKQRLVDAERAMSLERQQLNARLERSRVALLESHEALQAAREECAMHAEDAAEAKKALEANQARVAMVDKIMQDAETDRGILARRLLAAEAEVEAVKEEAKIPTRRMKGLETQLEHKETFLRDLARRHERVCNALDVARKAQQDIQRKQQEERLASIVSRGLSGGGGGDGDASSPRSSTLRQQLNAAMKKISFLETRLSMFEGQSNELGKSTIVDAASKSVNLNRMPHVSSASGLLRAPTILLEPSPPNANDRYAGGGRRSVSPSVIAASNNSGEGLSENTIQLGSTTLLLGNSTHLADESSAKDVEAEVRFGNDNEKGTTADEEGLEGGGLRQVASDGEGSSFSQEEEEEEEPMVAAEPTPPVVFELMSGADGEERTLSAPFVAQLNAMHSMEQQLRFAVATASSLHVDLSEAHRLAQDLQAQEKEQDRPRGAAAGGGGGPTAAADAQLPPTKVLTRLLFPEEDRCRRFFYGATPTSDNPLLRAPGRVRNHKFSLQAVKGHIHSFFADTAAWQSALPLAERFCTWMSQKYPEDSVAMMYSFYRALLWYRDDVDSYLFQSILIMERPESVWDAPYQVVRRLRERFEKGSLAHGGARIPRNDAVSILATELVTWELRHLEDLVARLGVEASIDWRRLFGLRAGKEHPFLVQLRTHWLSEYLQQLEDINSAVLEDASLGEGHVTPLVFVRAILAVDKKTPEYYVLELVEQLFGAEAVTECSSELHLLLPIQDRFTLSTMRLDVHTYVATLRRVSLRRFSRRLLGSVAERPPPKSPVVQPV